MNTLFISDLHLEPAHPGITQLFLNLLENQASQADALYILGDLFAAWIGDDDINEFNQTIIQALHKLTHKGVPVYFMHGNRDFLIGKKFIEQTGCQFLSDPTIIDLYGVPTLLMHGDTLCTEDKAYLRYRYFAHNAFLQKIFLKLPLAWRKKVARQLSNKSRNNMPSIMDAVPAEIERVIKQYQVTLLIHGHTHKPAIHSLEWDGQKARRIVLSDWHDDRGSVLVCTADGEHRLAL